MNQFERTELLLGTEALDNLKNSRVAVFGVGGVGGYTVEALARSGVGKLDLIDNDTVSITNLNRQIIALHSTLGQYKVDVAAARVKDINPDCEVKAHRMFYLPETAEQFDFTEYDYIVDAIDRAEGTGGRYADNQLDGRGQQARPDSLRGRGHQQNLCLSARSRNAHRMPQARNKEAQGRLLKGTGEKAARKAV